MVTQIFVTLATDRYGIWKVHLSRNMVFLKSSSDLWSSSESADHTTILRDAFFCVFEQLGEVNTFRSRVLDFDGRFESHEHSVILH
jgi:hypothetical protein